MHTLCIMEITVLFSLPFFFLFPSFSLFYVGLFIWGSGQSADEFLEFLRGNSNVSFNCACIKLQNHINS